MQNYRLYFLDVGGHVFSAEDQEARDDLAALEAARVRCKEHEIEIWQEARRVGRLKKGDGTLDASDRDSL